MTQLYRVVFLVGEDREVDEVYVETGDGMAAAISIGERSVRQENLVNQDVDVVEASLALDGPVVRLEDVADGH